MEMWLWTAIALALAAVVVQLWRIIGRDGLGHRPPPASHLDEPEALR
jgi:hypothetical protein